MIDPTWRVLLVCPVDHGPLRDAEDALACTECGRCYPVADGMPNMLPAEDAEGVLPDAEAQ